MNVQVHVDLLRIKIEVLDIMISQTYFPKLKIFATILGSQLSLSLLYSNIARYEKSTSTNNWITVEVYAPSKIHPHNIFLYAVASYVLTLKGGPRIDVNDECTY